MAKQLLVLLLVFSFVSSVSAQTAVNSTEAEKNLRSHVSYLASDALGGRRTGEAGATSAAGYVANMFAQYKLKAGVARTANGRTATNYLQSFPYVSGVELGKDNFLRVVPSGSGAKETKMEIGVNWKPVGFSPDGYIAPAPLVFAGYGIAARDANRDDYARTDAANKVALVFAGTPDAGNPHSLFARFSLHAKAKIAQEKGALALLVIAAENDFAKEKLAELKYDQTVGETAIPVAVIARSVAAQILGASDEKALAEIEKSAAGGTNVAENGEAKSAFELKSVAQLKIDLTRKQSAEAYNVIGVLEGKDPVLKAEAVVIGAHYDHLGKGGQGSLAINSAETHHGADDNASGVAALLELARRFTEAKNNRRTIIFIAFGGEEEGLLGSKHYVNNPVFPLAQTVAMINLDMVGRLKDEKLTIGGIGTASEWRELTLRVAINMPTLKMFQTPSAPNNQRSDNSKSELTAASPQEPIVLRTIPSIPVKDRAFDLQLNEDGFGPSDHSSFYGKQVPVLFFFTGTHADYHKPSDTAEKINYAGLLKITDYVGEIARSIDANQTKPTFALAKSSGMTGGRTGFSVSLGTVPSYGDSNDGMLIDAVRDASPAAKAGLKAGDKIVKLAGRDVRNVQDYTVILGELKAGEEYEIVVTRAGEKLTLKIVPAARK